MSRDIHPILAAGVLDGDGTVVPGRARTCIAGRGHRQARSPTLWRDEILAFRFGVSWLNESEERAEAARAELDKLLNQLEGIVPPDQLASLRDKTVTLKDCGVYRGFERVAFA